MEATKVQEANGTVAPKEKKEAKAPTPLTDKQKALAEVLKGLTAQGIDSSDFLKVVSALKKSGDIKSPGKGKQAEDNPFKISIRTLITGDKAIIDGLNTYFTTKDKDDKLPSSLMVKLNDNLSLNFVRKQKKVKKAKTVVAATDTAAQSQERGKLCGTNLSVSLTSFLPPENPLQV